MNTVAILAVILGPAVGALGVFFGWLQSKGEREQSLALARTQQDHALALTEGQQSHEHRLRSGDRLFEKRGDLYVRLLGFLERQLLGVERTNPFMTIGPPQDPPGPEDEKESRSCRPRSAYTERAKSGNSPPTFPTRRASSTSRRPRSTLPEADGQERQPSTGKTFRTVDRRYAT